MQIEQLLNPDLHIDLQSDLLHLRQDSTPAAVLLGQIDLEQDAIFFGASSSPKSFSGHLSGNLEDEEVIEYIRRNNWVLYDRLWGSSQNGRLDSVTSAINDPEYLSDGAPSGLQSYGGTNKRESKMFGATRVLANPQAHRYTPIAPQMLRTSIKSSNSCSVDAPSVLSSVEQAALVAALASSCKDGPQPDLHLLRQRRYIQSLLLSGDILVLQKVGPSEAKVRSSSCDHPRCKCRYGVPSAVYRLSFELKRIFDEPKDEYGDNDPKLRSSNSRGLYCLACIEDLFSGISMLDDAYPHPLTVRQASLLPPGLTSPPMSFDGSLDDNLELRTIVLQKAEKLLPPVHLAKDARVRINVEGAIDLLERPSPDLLEGALAYDDLGTSLSKQILSNSDNAVLLRNAKSQETQTTLRLLRQIACRREAQRLSLSNDELPNVNILRPIDLPPHEERYKKQGLGIGDRRLWRSSLIASRVQQNATLSIDVNMTTKDSLQLLAPVQRFCSCREPENSEVMVLCSAELCLVGWFHLSCSGLSRLPTKDETWFCSECSAFFGRGTFNPTLELRRERVVGHHRVLRSTVRGASRLTDGNDVASAPSDEFSNHGTSLPLSDDETMDPTYTLPTTPRRQSKTVVGMSFTPYKFLDGAGDKNLGFCRLTSTEETLIPNNSALATLTSVEDEPKGTKHRLIRRKRACTLALLDPQESSMPMKRLKKISSPPSPLKLSSRPIKTRFGDVMSLIYPETRTSAEAPSNSQIVARTTWQSIHPYSHLIESLGLADSNRPSRAAPMTATVNHPRRVLLLQAMQHWSSVEPSLTFFPNTLRKQGSTGCEHNVHTGEETAKAAKAKGSQAEE